MGNKIQLSEKALTKIIKESVQKVVNEISSDMLMRARDKFSEKYRNFPNFERDEYGNPLHPKDKRLMADHYRNFDRAISNAKRDEAMQDPVTKEAMEIWNDVQSDVDWDITDDFGNEGCEVTGYIEVDGWEFSASGYAERAGGLNVEEIESVEFRSPDGKEGSFRP